MASNKGKKWTKGDVSHLRQLAKNDTKTTTIAKRIGRTTNAIYSKASEKKITLKPKD